MRTGCIGSIRDVSRTSAVSFGVAGTPRPKEDGGVGASLADFDLDGDFDLFVANYGPSALYRNEGGASFMDVARDRRRRSPRPWRDLGVGRRGQRRPAGFYVGNFIAGQPLYRDAFFLNRPRDVCVRRGAARRALKRDATHGVRFVDFDRDGRLDLSLTNNDPAGGGHPLWRNIRCRRAVRSSIEVADGNARRTRAGAEVRAIAPARASCSSAELVDREPVTARRAKCLFTSACRASWQGRIDVEITTMIAGARHTQHRPRDRSRFISRPRVAHHHCSLRPALIENDRIPSRCVSRAVITTRVKGSDFSTGQRCLHFPLTNVFQDHDWRDSPDISSPSRRFSLF